MQNQMDSVHPSERLEVTKTLRHDGKESVTPEFDSHFVKRVFSVSLFVNASEDV